MSFKFWFSCLYSRNLWLTFSLIIAQASSRTCFILTMVSVEMFFVVRLFIILVIFDTVCSEDSTLVVRWRMVRSVGVVGWLLESGTRDWASFWSRAL